jgi:UDP-N-acetylglucosamine--N-acetylmuramyl-(pentapeptide) pyrophosphoryl-undecaprenol N-acetylglucosamine transferase
MTAPGANTPFVAIACGGTGGHLFPGLAVAEQLQKRGCVVTLLVSPKEVDQIAVKSVRGMEIVTLPAVALQNRNYLSFARSFWQSWRASRKLFQSRPPHAVLAMGGFTSAPPILAARKFGARTFLHESNTIPGRANRFLARFVDEAFVGFPDAAAGLRARKVTRTGTPVRPQFHLGYPAPCRAAFGLEPNRPTVLVMGGSQGASGINDMIVSALPLLDTRDWQWLHLAGTRDCAIVQAAYDKYRLDAVVKPFFAKMDLALGAATAAVSRAGASSLAEIAAMLLPSLLVPFPAAADNHQFQNARAFEATGAARLLEEKNATPDKLVALLCELVEGSAARVKIKASLVQWHAPKAAEQIADIMLAPANAPRKEAAGQSPPPAGSGPGAGLSTKPAVSPNA